MTTIKDVAEKAGVTVTTVSRVLNNRGYISQATREKVNRVMEEMQYQPNEIARSLLGKRSMMLGMIIPTVAHPFFGELANYIENYASSLGYKILICNSRMEQLKEKEYIEMLKSNRVEGIIMGSHTLEVHEYTQLQADVFENLDYERAIRKLLDEHPDVDGIFTTSDMIAINVIKVCASIGIKVPEQLKLIGYDDIQFASLIVPGLTTIRQPLEEMSKLAVDLIDKLVAGDKVPMENMVPVTLIERNST